jgi:hypothetical protein
MGGTCGTYGKDNIAYRVVWSRVQAIHRRCEVYWSLRTDMEGANWTDVAWSKERVCCCKYGDENLYIMCKIS